jgi:hypothetical protein
MDDFEAFRKRKKEQEEEKKREAERASQPAASGKPMDWVDGFGPAGPTNPKVKGFMLGRYRKKKIDPSELEKPEGYESHSRAPDVQSKAEIEIERRKRALEKAQAELEAAQAKAELAEIEARRKEEGIGRIKGRQRY